MNLNLSFKFPHIVLLFLIYGGFLGGFALNVAFAKTEGSRPNILFAFADDWGRYASAYGAIDGKGSLNEVIQTPHFDRVAQEGAVFKNAFVTAPSCTPCRSSLLSGQYFWRTGLGAILQGAKWDPKIPSYPLLLEEAGYHIGQTYKVWSPGTPRDAPYGEERFAYEKAGGRFNRFSQTVTGMVENGRSVEEAKQVLYQEVEKNFESFLNRRKSGDPFCYWFGPTLVHRKWVKGSGKKLWGINPDALKDRMPAFLPDVPEIREDLADYFGEIQAFDAGLGVLLRKLEAIGELDNTLIVVSGDHGAPGFPNGKCNLYDFGVGVPLAIRWGKQIGGGRVIDDFVNLMDLAPTFLEAAGLTPPSVMTGRSLVDVFNSGRSGQIDPSRTWVITGRERHVAAARSGMMPYPQRALRTQDFLYIHNFRPDRWPMGTPLNLEGESTPDQRTLTQNTMITYMDMDAGPTKAWLIAHRHDPEWKRFYQIAFGKHPREELYDLSKDPDQVKNVAGELEYATDLNRLRVRLLDELERTGDPRVLNDGMTFDRPPFSGAIR
ncbi:MAG TPA: sulfatase [Verrucomicrobiales bacterium]|nr:sulfatase [Verrucomicrobiales bacterium]HIL70825.1 sulfatase [Verrucomicrobiota bacterium]